MEEVDSDGAHWPVDEPDTLEDLCLRFCMNHPQTIGVYPGMGEHCAILERIVDRGDFIPGFSLPRNFCDKIFSYIQYNIMLHGPDSGVYFRRYLALFKDYCQIQSGRYIVQDEYSADWKTFLTVGKNLQDVRISCHVLCRDIDFSRQLFFVLNQLSNLKCLKLKLDSGCEDCKGLFMARCNSNNSDMNSLQDSDEIDSDASSHDFTGGDTYTRIDIKQTKRSQDCEHVEFHENVSEGSPTIIKGRKESRLVGETEVKREETIGNDGALQTLVCPSVQFLSLTNVPFRSMAEGQTVLATILSCMEQLTKLDLSDCDLDLEFMDCLESLTNLTVLILANVKITDVRQAFENICKPKKLRYLDISNAHDQDMPVQYTDPADNLSYLVKNLPDLRSLDLSGTNLTIPAKMQADREAEKVASGTEEVNCPIPALGGRQFEFLGLWNCPQHVCRRQNIPASQITGDADEDQVLLALQMYLTNEHLLLQVLNVCGKKMKQENLVNFPALLQYVLMAMETHMRHPDIAKITSLLVYLICEGNEDKVTQQQRRKIFETLLPLIQVNRENVEVVRHCMYVFLCLNLPETARNCYMLEHYLCILLHVMSKMEPVYSFRESVGFILLHNVCRADNWEKGLVITSGFLEFILDFLEKRLQLRPLQSPDQRVEKAWSCIWSLTDEAPESCKEFVTNGRGMDLMLKYIQRFSDHTGIMKKITGLLSNLAEVSELHSYLMTEEILTFLSDKLTTIPKAIEISYHATSILSNLAMEGEEVWTVSTPNRDEVLDKMKAEIASWDVTETRRIKYRSLCPMIMLSEIRSCPAAQYWGVWALLNLVKTRPERYCHMLTIEGGLPVLKQLIGDDLVEACSQELARQTIEECTAFEKFGKPSEPF
ncbi:hypothetical protein ScPMuIL_004247 [Solemya velum]